jgi:tetratricopeptide (TPR) repeat protein
MSWTATVLRAVLIVGILLWLVDLFRWPIGIREAQLALWRRSGNRTRTRQTLRRLAAHAEVRGDSAAAVELRRDIIESGLPSRTPDLPTDLTRLAGLLYRYGRFAEAAEWFAELDRCTADDHRLKPTILISMGYNLSYLGRYDEAESALRRASALAVGWDQWQQRRRLRSRTTRWNLAMAHGYIATALGRFQDARGWYESALSLSMTLARVKRLASLNNLAHTALEMGDLENAEHRVEEVNQLAGSDSWAGRDRFMQVTADLRLAQGRRKEARDMLSGVLALRGTEPGALLTFAEIAYGEGRFDEAIAYVAQIQTNPVDAATRRRLAETLDRLAEVDEDAGRQVEAEERRRRALALQKPQPPPPVPDDTLLGQVRSTFAGKCFGPPGPLRGAARGLYISAFLWLGLSILLPLDPVFPIPVLQAAALVLLILGFSRFSRWVLGPRPCAVSAA